MIEDDPFADFTDDDRTVIRPSPGGRRRDSPLEDRTEVRQAPTHVPKRPKAGLSESMSDRRGMVAVAFSLLSLANQLRNSATHRDVPALHSRMVEEIRLFEKQGLRQGITPEHMHMGRYALCTLIDETVLNTPWGSNSLWSQKSMLITFHKEAWGGEKFFQYLNRVVRQPSTNLDLLELFYYCLSLGLQGKYRVAEHGETKLEQLRSNLYVLLERQRGDIEHELSGRWEGVKDRRNVLVRYIPLWVIGSVVGALLLAVYLGYLFLINRDSDPVFKDLYAIGREVTPKPPVVSPAPEPVQPVRESPYKKLRVLLASEIARQELEVTETNEGTVVRIRGLFASAQDRVKQKYYPLLTRVAEGLADELGQITVAGYTDNVPIRTIKFPSNWDLSEGRAKDVARILLSSGQLEGRVQSEGRADREPVSSNETPSGRALNRRVDIILR